MAIASEIPVLYRADTIDGFTERLMRNGFAELDLDDHITSIGDDFAAVTESGRNKGVENLLETVHRIYAAKSILELPLMRKSLDDLVVKGIDTKGLRKLDNFYTGILVSGFNLVFNLALSELYYAVDRFPDGVSEECKEFCKTLIRDAASYSRNDVKFNDDKKRFEGKDGERFVRQEPPQFKVAYDASHGPVKEGRTHIERSILAVYKAFADQYKRFKDDTGILSASVVDEGKIEESIDTALVRLLKLEEHLSEIKPVRLAIRYHLTKNVLAAFSDTREGYEILEGLTGKSLDLKSPGWIKRINPTTVEKVKLGYLNIRYGKRGQKISDIVFYHGLATVFVHGIVQTIGRAIPEVDAAINSVPVIGYLNNLFAHPAYKTVAFGAFLLALDKIPAALLRGAYQRIQNVTYS